MSAGDYTARAAQLASSIVIVGARSAGAFGVLVEPTRLPTNPDIFVAADPFRAENKEGRRIEGESVVPDVLVELEPMDLARGIDTVLEAAARRVKP